MTSERSVAPGLLLAMPQLQDPNFHRSVVLMIHHDEDGSFGLVVNRPNTWLVSEMLSPIGVAWGGEDEAVVWEGGPVSPQSGFLLHSAPRDPQEHGDLEILPGLELSTSQERIRDLASEPPDHVRFLLGYAGWAAGQLESELAQGAWLLAEADPELVFSIPAERMWETALRCLGIEPSMLVPGSGVH
jgi:putative transcriptional regulator